MNRLLLISFILIVFASCKSKEDPSEEMGNPVFEIKGSIDGKLIAIKAGKENYYMGTGYIKDPLDVFVFSGTLKKLDCPTCGPSLKLAVRNYKEGSVFAVSEALTATEYKFLDNNAPTTYYEVQFKSSAEESIAGIIHSWDIGNEVKSSDPAPFMKFRQAGTYTINHSVQSPTGPSSLSQDIVLKPSRVGSNLDFKINPMESDSSRIKFSHIPFIDPSGNYSWYLDNSPSPFGFGDLAEAMFPAAGQHKVCMMRVEGIDTITYCRNVNRYDFDHSTANYAWFTRYVVDPLNLSNIDIEWTDENGNVYSSANVVQDNSSSFLIIKSADYLANEKGQKTKILTVKFSCKVSDGTKDIEIRDMTATMAVTFP